MQPNQPSNFKVFYNVPAYFSDTTYCTDVKIKKNDLPENLKGKLNFIVNDIQNKGVLPLKKQSEVEIMCGDGRSLVLEDEKSQAHTLSPIRSFGSTAGIFGAWVEYLCKKNNIDSNNFESYKELIEKLATDSKLTLKRLSQPFHVHTDDGVHGEGDLYSAGCAHVNGYASVNPAFHYFMKLMEDVAVISSRTGEHNEAALVVCRGKFTLYRGGEEQFFSIDGRIRVKIQEIIHEYNSMYSSDSNMFVSEDELMDIYLEHILNTCKKLVLSKDLPIVFINTSNVHLRLFEGKPTVSGEASVKIVPTDENQLRQLLKEVFTIWM